MEGHDALAVGRDVQIERRVIVRPAVVLVEAGDDGDFVVSTRGAPRSGEIACKTRRGEREIVDRAFEKVTRKGGLRKNDELRAGTERRERLAAAAQIFFVPAFDGLHLHDRDRDARAPPHLGVSGGHRRWWRPPTARRRESAYPTAQRKSRLGTSRFRRASDADVEYA